MSQSRNNPDQNEELDWIDTNPIARRVASNLERSFRPSCLISLIITAILVILIRRYIKLPIAGMVIMTFVIWWAVLVVMVRLSGPNIDDD
jgi:predicted RND superfamily exporter protein